jgi:hypothetical protein
MDLPEHDETTAQRDEGADLELVDPDEALLRFPSENVEHLATPISQDHALPKGKTDDRAEKRPADERAATARGVARRGSVLLVSAGSFVFGVAAGAAAVVWLSGPSASSAAAARTAAPQLVTSEHPVGQVYTVALSVPASAAVQPHGHPPQASPAPARSPSTGTTSFRGSLIVSSRPSGAYVSLNGLRAGTTPLVLKNQRVGSRAVRIELDGYEAWTSAVQVVTNTSTNVRADLKAMRGLER